MTVKLDPHLICVPKCPGYFYNRVTDKLYSIKSGELRPLTLQKPSRYPIRNPISYAHYRVSVKGTKKIISLNFLRNLDAPKYDVYLLCKE